MWVMTLSAPPLANEWMTSNTFMLYPKNFSSGALQNPAAFAQSANKGPHPKAVAARTASAARPR
jgi:hypothetical protein